MRRRAVSEGVQHAAELLLNDIGTVSSDLESPQHDLRQMVADRAGAQLVAVADDVVLIGQDIERIAAVQRLQLALRHRERIVREINVIGLVVHLEHREIHDPDELEPGLIDQVEIGSQLGAR